MRSLPCWRLALLAIALCSRVYALGGDHPTNQTVNLDKAPPGLNELINQTNRVHGFFVNAEDRFFFVGETEAFSAFLAKYAQLAGIAGHRLTVHEGNGQAKSPWDKGDGKVCDWMLEVAPVSWYEGHEEAKKVFFDRKTSASGAEKPYYLAEVHVWARSKVNLWKLTIPMNVNVTREAHAKDKAANQPSEGTR